MIYVSFLKLLLSFITSYTQYIRDKQLMEAGKAEAILKGINDADEAIKRANDARSNVDSVPVNADPNNRDNR